MKRYRILLFVAIILVFNSCNFRYSYRIDVKNKYARRDSIYSYLFSNTIKQKEVNYLFYKNTDFEIDITFDHSPEKLVRTKLKTIDFERKTEIESIQVFSIDSVSFSADKAPEHYDLFYYCRINQSPQKVQFALVKTGEKWKIP